ncbi:hypothetical protein I7I48_02707 [Histoplasma ohiense]|nr:hypothetical protein I7I48_02707 [Histoplasma ohiense (nom. inval.)]
MPKAIKLTGKAPATTPPAQTPPHAPTDESPQSVTLGDGYQHSEPKELAEEALREVRADSTTSKPNPSEDTAGGFASPKQDGKKVLQKQETELDNASKLKPQEQETSSSRNAESESPVLMDKYMPDIPPNWMECDPLFMDNVNVGFDPVMKECFKMTNSPKEDWVAKSSKERGKPENYVRARAIANPTDSFEDLAEAHNA